MGGFFDFMKHTQDKTEKMITGFLNLGYLESVIIDGLYRSTYELPELKQTEKVDLIKAQYKKMFEDTEGWEHAILVSRCV